MNPRALFAIGAALLLGGCAATQAPGDLAPAPIVDLNPAAGDVESIGRYVAGLAALGPDEATRERAQATRAFESRPGEPERLRLAALLSLGPAGVRNDARALELLLPLVGASDAPGRSANGIAVLLHALLTERSAAAARTRELRSRLDAGTAEQRAADASARELQKRLEATMNEQKRAVGTAQELQRKLDALKALERSFIERERSGTAGAP
jgi:hypothetical protein